MSNQGGLSIETELSISGPNSKVVLSTLRTPMFAVVLLSPPRKPSIIAELN